MEFDADQERVLREAREWLAGGGPQVKYLAGYAGTGKTTLAKALAEGFMVQFCAYTGKAALVLREKGCENACTIHSLIYKAIEKRTCSKCGERINQGYDTCYFRCVGAKVFSKTEYRLRSRDWESGDDTDRIFELIDNNGVIIVDECSMLSDEVADDLLSFGVKVLVIGDPFQLPPVNGEGKFTSARPDWMLTEIHRQARESGVLRLATDIRSGGYFDRTRGAYGDDVLVIPRGQVDLSSLYEECNQLLVGRNITRQHFNGAAREFLGLRGPIDARLPTTGDKIVCLRNDRETGLVNGGQWAVLASSDLKHDLTLSVSVFGDPESPPRLVNSHYHYFTGDDEILKQGGWHYRRERQEFDYAYAMTVHKSQGSQWDHVAVVDESYCFRESRLNWLYTAVTRAARKVTVIV